MNRIETKFLLDISQFEHFRERCRMLFQPDKNSKNGNAYPILSAYFDTPDLKFFYQKINGEFNHSKVRLRNYGANFGPESACFLEVKSKQNENQSKLRIPVQFNKKLLDPKNWFNLEHPDIDKLLLVETNLTHIVNVYYEREAYEWHCPENGKVRINFDSNFAALPRDQHETNKLALETYRLLPSDKVICEVKTPGQEMPLLIKKELKAIGVEQKRISKYAEAIISVNDRINSNEAIS